MPSNSKKQSLAVTHPELAKQADGWDPSTFTHGSSKKLSWICVEGHRWDTSPKHRSNGTGCPVCSGQKIVSGFNDLATTNPDLADEADGWNPSSDKLVFSQKFKWCCSTGHKWEASITSRKRGSGCPSCAGVRLTHGENDLSTNYPELAKEVVGVDPSTLSVTSKRKVEWKCKYGHTFVAAIGDRTRGQGCGVCTGKQVKPGVNDLFFTHPELAAEADGWDPTTVGRGSNRKLQWKCKSQHTWTATPNSRTGGNSNCPVCGGRKLLIGVNDLKSVHPEIAADAFGWDPTQELAGSNKRMSWQCLFGHRWQTSISLRIHQRTGCPVCSGHKLETGFNDLATTHPDLALQVDGWDPRMVSAGSHRKMRWKCALEHTWTADIHSRAAGVGCPICRNKKVLTGFNDLRTTHPEIAFEPDGWDPSLIVAGSNKNLAWRCTEGHSWVTSPNKRAYGRRGCPSCANTGFNPHEKAFLYFLNHGQWKMYQIGITNFPQERIAKHKTLGWEVIEIRGPMDGHITQKWERAILRMLKANGADLSNSSVAGKFDGYTEAWSSSTFEVKSIRELMVKTEEFEIGNS